MNALNLIPISLFAVVAGATYALLRWFDSSNARVQSRVEGLLGDGHGSAHSSNALPQQLAVALPRLTAWLEKTKPLELENKAGLEKRLVKAGLHSRSAVAWYFAARLFFMVIPCAAMIAVGVAGYVPIDRSLLLGFCFGGLGAYVPTFWLDRRIYKHHLTIRRALPDFLDLMIVCLEGGLSLQETLRRVNEELQIAHPVFARELSIVQQDIDVCASPDQALKRWAARTDFEGIRTLSTFIRESQKFGTQITDALRNHAEMMRSQREQCAEENAQKAAVKILLPTLLLIFPAIFVVLVGPAVIQIQHAFAAK
jgi:tight adherence protein C